jgi:hypothetical protein
VWSIKKQRIRDKIKEQNIGRDLKVKAAVVQACCMLTKDIFNK